MHNLKVWSQFFTTKKFFIIIMRLCHVMVKEQSSDRVQLVKTLQLTDRFRPHEEALWALSAFTLLSWSPSKRVQTSISMSWGWTSWVKSAPCFPPCCSDFFRNCLMLCKHCLLVIHIDCYYYVFIQFCCIWLKISWMKPRQMVSICKYCASLVSCRRGIIPYSALH